MLWPLLQLFTYWRHVVGQALPVCFDGRQAWLVAASQQTVRASKVQAHRGHDTRNKVRISPQIVNLIDWFCGVDSIITGHLTLLKLIL